MLHRRNFLLGSAAAGFAAAAGRAAAQTDTPRAMLEQATGRRESVAGMIAVAVDEDGTRLTAHGSSGISGLAMDADTVFEIGSITKVLTALLLADMAERGEVGLDDPVADHLPEAPGVNGRPITLRDLAAYRSGLPDMPGNLPREWLASDDPLGRYSAGMLLEFMAGFAPEHAPGAHYEYSNVAFGLLGAALAHRAGKGFEDLLVERICDPLGLADTRIALTQDMRVRAVQGRNLGVMPAPFLDMPGLMGAGAVRSTAGDMTLFLRAVLGLAPTPLAGAMARLLETRTPTPLAGTEAALGWFVSSDTGGEIVWKSGVTAGCSTCVAWSPRRRRGAVVLANFLSRPEGGGAIDGVTLGVAASMIDPDFHPGDMRALY